MASANRPSSSQAPLAAPYEPLVYPLSAAQRTDLSKLRHEPDLANLDALLKAAAATLGDCALEINELASLRKDLSTNSAAVEREDEGADSFQEKVDTVSKELEKAVRVTIDEMRSVQDMSKALREANDVHLLGAQRHTVQSRQAAQVGGTINVDDEDDDVEITQAGGAAAPAVGPGPGPGPKVIFEEALKAEKEKYDLISNHNRYSEMAPYINFKRSEWEGKHAHIPDDEQPDLPSAKHWFTEAGAPGPGTVPDDSDDDLQTLRATLSTKCPLTYGEIVTPASNHQCKHIFEDSAIRDLIKQTNVPVRGRPQGESVDCPVPGCSKKIYASDLFFDKFIARKIERVRAARSAEGGSTARNRGNVVDLDNDNEEDDGFDDVDEEEGDVSTQNAAASSRREKMEPRSSRF